MPAGFFLGAASVTQVWSPPSAAVGRRFFATVSVLVLAVVLPIVIRGAPLADDYHNCVRPTEVGYSGFLSESLHRLGAVRPARFVEIFAIGPLCDRVPFGIVILVPLALTALVAVLLCGLL